MTQEEKDLVENSYTRYEPQDASSPLVKEYPFLVKEAVYFRNSVQEDTLSRLNDIFGVSTWTFIYTMQGLASQSGMEISQEEEMCIRDRACMVLYAFKAGGKKSRRLRAGE